MTRSRNHWLPYGEPDVALPRVFCFPHAGGGAANFAPWLDLAGPGLVVCPAQPPGRAERFRHPAHSHVESYVDEVVASAGHLFTGDYVLFGHSAGALAAFRLAHRLVAEGRPPLHLFVSGRLAPHVSSGRRPVHDRPTEELIPLLRLLGGTPDEVLDDPDLLELFLPLLRADFALNETYRHNGTPPLPIPLTAFAGADDPRAGPDEVGRWGELTSASFESHVFPGGHFYLDQHASGVLAVIRRAFNRRMEEQ